MDKCVYFVNIKFITRKNKMLHIAYKSKMTVEYINKLCLETRQKQKKLVAKVDQQILFSRQMA